MSNKAYLGDGVYVELDEVSKMVKLTTDNGFGPSNTIWLENAVVDAFLLWVLHNLGDEFRAFERVWEEGFKDG